MTKPTNRPTSVQGAMKQTAKTEAERGEPKAEAAKDPAPKGGRKVREGDQPIDQSTTGGSSPCEEPHHAAKKQRST